MARAVKAGLHSSWGIASGERPRNGFQTPSILGEYLNSNVSVHSRESLLKSNGLLKQDTRGSNLGAVVRASMSLGSIFDNLHTMNKLFSYLHTKSREEKFRLFVKLLKPTPAMHILNVGASGPNFAFAEQFESLYEHRDQVTGGGISLSEVRDYRGSFPGVKAVVFDGCALPFRDKSFDVIYSNAVIEHLADHDAQQHFAAEVVRVGRGWFVTTPNLYYPVEPHYHLPLVQFLPQRWQRSLVRSLGRTPYGNLNLLTKRQLQRLLPDGDVIGCRVTFYSETLVAYRAP